MNRNFSTAAAPSSLVDVDWLTGRLGFLLAREWIRQHANRDKGKLSAQTQPEKKSGSNSFHPQPAAQIKCSN
jgi:hypothetical protein